MPTHKSKFLYATAEYLVKSDIAELRDDLVGGRSVDEILNRYLCVPAKPTVLPGIYRRALESAQNHGRMTKAILSSLPTENLDDLKVLLENWNPRRIATQFSDEKKLLSHLIDNVPIKRKIELSPRSMWPKFCGSIISIANFLKRFKNAEEFHAWAGSFCAHPETRAALPLVLAQEIKGFGVPLACDFVKEVGYAEFGKPDIHIKDVFEGVDILTSTNDYFVMLKINELAEEIGVTSYQYDKMIWLCCSGHLYLDQYADKPKQTKVKFSRRKADLIERVRKGIKIPSTKFN